ncbi:MAG: glycoside hydrolase family 88 protein [Paludibacteraceae bacterium]
MKRHLLSFFLVHISIVLFAELPSKTEVIDQMKSVNNYWISQNENPGNNQWARAAYFVGNMDFYKIYPKDTYLQYAERWCGNNNWSLNGGNTTRNADNQTCGQVYVDLYHLDASHPQSKIASISQNIYSMVNSTKSDDWWWIDALFMAMPVFTRLGVLNNDSVYFNRMYDLYKDNKIRRGLFNAQTGLWYRDESYKPPYTTVNGKDSYWSRGNGWVIAAPCACFAIVA